jgi:hypothetical protein
MKNGTHSWAALTRKCVSGEVTAFINNATIGMNMFEKINYIIIGKYPSKDK